VGFVGGFGVVRNVPTLVYLVHDETQSWTRLYLDEPVNCVMAGSFSKEVLIEGPPGMHGHGENFSTLLLLYT